MQADQSAWPYDLLGALYDDDMGRNAPGHDVEFYVEPARTAGGSVLELGCGTGRITLPLVRAGLSVTGVDRSRRMLDVLHSKAERELSSGELARLRIEHMDMRELALHTIFDSVFCPYSAFTYLTSDEDRVLALACVRAHLRAGGSFVLDVFIPDPAILGQPDDAVIVDYTRQRADGTLLERSRTIRKDVEPGINLIERRYRVLGSDGRERESFTTESRIRYWFPEDLRRELAARGFEVLEVSLDFGCPDPKGRSTMAAFRCKPR